MQLGESGKKYGLIMPSKGGLQAQKPGVPPAKKPPANVASVFGGDSDEDDGVEGHAAVNKELERQQARLRASQQMAQMQQKLTEEDPNIFDFDAHYDDIQASKNAQKQAKLTTVDRRPKYIQNLLDKAQERKMEQEILFERKNAKEVAKEEDELGQKERYVTAAYKKKLEEQKRWLEREKQREEEEAKNDVTKRTDLGDLHRNLLRASGLVGSIRGGDPAAAEEEARKKKEQEEREREKKEREREEREKAAGTFGTSEAPSMAGRPSTAEDHAAPMEKPSSVPVKRREEVPARGGGESEEEEEGEGKAAQAPPAARELTREEKAALAKERYLARKRKAQDIA